MQKFGLILGLASLGFVDAANLPDLPDVSSTGKNSVDPLPAKKIKELPKLPRVEQPSSVSGNVPKLPELPSGNSAAAKNLPPMAGEALNKIQDENLENIDDSADPVPPAPIQPSIPLDPNNLSNPEQNLTPAPPTLHQIPKDPAPSQAEPPKLPVLPGAQGNDVQIDKTKALQFSYNGIIPGAVVPFRLSDAEDLELNKVNVEVHLRQNSARYIFRYTFKNTGSTLTSRLAFPLEWDFGGGDNLPAEFGSLPFREGIFQEISELSLGVDGTAVKTAYVQDEHPQISAPSLQPLAGLKNWITGDVKFRRNETREVTLSFIAPLPSGVVLNPKERKTRILSKRLGLNLSPAYIWKDNVRDARIRIIPEEMLAESIGKRQGFQIQDGGLIWNIQNWTPTMRDRIEVEAVPELVVQDLPEGNSHVTTNLPIGNGKTTNLFSVQASSTLKDASGQSHEAENIKNFTGFWAEGVEGNGVGESLTLTLNEPKELVGFELSSGVHPSLVNGGMQNANAVFRGSSRPIRVQITLNGDYKFYATLRDDWRPQYIIQPGYFKKVQTINFEIQDVKEGNRILETCITRLLPIIKD